MVTSRTERPWEERLEAALSPVLEPKKARPAVGAEADAGRSMEAEARGRDADTDVHTHTAELERAVAILRFGL